MLKAIFIGHPYHQKTQSHIFFTEILEQECIVDYYTTNSENKKNTLYPDLCKNITCDVLIFWQVKPDKNLLKNITYRKILFFPMYDSCSNWYIEKWISLYKCHIICFSKTVYRRLWDYGFHVDYVQYFPKPPQDITNWGNPQGCFHWFRRAEVKTNILQKLLPNIKTIHIHQAPDPNSLCSDNIIPQDNITISEWFTTKHELNNHIQNYGLYLAPRTQEGIGMSFLEAMSMGRCVIAPNMPTMNEYITHKVNGLLYDPKNPQAFDINPQDIIDIQKNTHHYIKNGYEQWQKDKQKLLKIIKNFSEITKSKPKRYYLHILYRIITNPLRARRFIKEYIKRI